jgi:hypothetical protein
MANTTKIMRFLRNEMDRYIYGVDSFGTIWYVDSNNGSTSYSGREKDRALTTLEGALAVASAGDTIIIAENHSETITGAGGIALDLAGIRIVGQGHGNRKPTFLMDGATTVNGLVSAADIRLENCIFNAGHADINNCFQVAAKGFTVSGCEFVENTATENWEEIFEVVSTTDNIADRLTILDCKVLGADTGNNMLLLTASDIDRLTIQGCEVQLGSANEPFIEAVTGKDLSNVMIGGPKGRGNTFNRAGSTASPVLILTDTTETNTGLIANNLIGCADTQTQTLAIATCEFRYFENYLVSVVDKSGFILPAIDSAA